MQEIHNAANGSTGNRPAEAVSRTLGSPRRRNGVLLVLALCLGLYTAYAGRRTPIESQQGIGISWPSDSRPVAKPQFRVAIYNIQSGKGTDGIRDLGRTAGVLRAGDLVGLNELRGPTLWGRPDQAEQLGRTLKIGWQFAPNQRRWHTYHFGNGLLSRFDVGRWTDEPLIHDKAKGRSHRNLLTAEVLAGEPPITFLVTHLDRGAIRPVQLQHVLEHFVQYTPAILVGDFNTTAADPLLVALFADRNNVDAIAQALGASDDKRRIDWIITRGLHVLGGGMEPVGVSDHPYYWVDVELARPAGDGTGMEEME